MTRTQFLEACSVVAVAVADHMGLADVVTAEPSPPPLPLNIHDFDFENGTVYPSVSKVSLHSFEVPVGATVAHVPLTLDKPSRNTVIAEVRCLNGDGGRANPDTTKRAIFRPGETEASIAFNVVSMAEGNTVKFVQSNMPDGGGRDVTGAVATAQPGAVNEPVVSTSEAQAFQPFGELVYSATGKQALEDGNWLDRLAHGRTQVGNAETGYYMPREDGAFDLDGDDLILRSRRLPEPIQVGTPLVSYPFAASVLTGLLPGDSPRINPAVCFRYGTIEWEAKMPNRRGSWPALWLLSSRNGWPKWPFEIDVFEGFYYNNEFRAGSQLSTNLHGGAEGSNTRTFTRASFRHTMSTYGLDSTLDSAFHKFACVVDPDWITMFVDGIETFRYANPFTSTEAWYPIMNVAVKASPTSAYDEGSGDMTVRSVKIWRDS